MKTFTAYGVALTWALLASATHGASEDAQPEGALPPSPLSEIDPARFNIDAQEIAAIKQGMQAAVDADYIAGALLLVGNSDGVGLLETVGTQGPTDQQSVNEETIFRIYSMTKPVVSVAAMSLIEDGVLSLDDPVGDYIPAFNDLQIMGEDGTTRPAQHEMRIENLLTHQSGLIQSIFAVGTPLGAAYQENVPVKADLTSTVTALEVAQSIGQLPLAFEPGTAWHYGHSTDVLGAVLEVAADKPLDEILAEHIFNPLGMDETTFYVPQGKSSRIAQPIHGDMSDNTDVRAFLSAGAGLNSTTEDYARFAQMLLNGGEYQGQRIIEQATLERMRQPEIDDSVSRDNFFFGPVGNWGLGFHLQPIDPGQPEGPYNFGWRGIGGTLFLVDPVNDFYMLYMEQRMGGPSGAPFDNNAAQRVVYDAIRN